MTEASRVEKRKHRRSVSRKLDDQEYCFDKQPILVEENNKTMFDVEYFVHKSTQSTEEETLIIDHLNDENNPPCNSNNVGNSLDLLDNCEKKKTSLNYKTKNNKPHKESDYYFSLWEEDENFACLKKLKHYFHSDQQQKSDFNNNSKAKLFREKHKNKILEINAEYQMFNCHGFNMFDNCAVVDYDEAVGSNKVKAKCSKRYVSAGLER